jgi:hypothetical protein
MRYATCQETIRETVVVPQARLDSALAATVTRVVSRKCGLPCAPDRNGLCASCENTIHEMSEQHAEALEMNECRNYLMGDDSALETANWYAELTATCRKSRRMAEA